MEISSVLNASINPGEAFVNTLTNTSLWAAICSTVGIIALGYILVKVKVFKQEWSKVLNSIVLKVALPALALSGFMSNASVEQLQQQGVILGVSFAFYIILSVVAMVWVNFFPKFLPRKVKTNQAILSNGQIQNINEPLYSQAQAEQEKTNQKRALVMWMMLIFGSTTFFGQPIIKILYPTDGVIAANIWNIPYRIFLYSFCFMVMSGLKFDRKNIRKSVKTTFLNPIIICTFLGLILWLTQLIPGASSYGENFTNGENGWFNLSVTMPYFYTPINTVGSLSSPLVWFSIGITLAGSSLLMAAKDKWVWIFSVEKLVLIPLIIFLVMLGLVSSNTISLDVGVSMVIYAATPPATVAIAYAMQYKMADKFATQCSALCTLLAIIAIPLWIIISVAVFQLV